MDKSYICGKCGLISNPKKFYKFSFLSEFIFWIISIVLAIFVNPLFLLGILAISMLRVLSGYKGCPDCELENMIPLDSIVGKELKEKIGREIETKTVDAEEFGRKMAEKLKK